MPHSISYMKSKLNEQLIRDLLYHSVTD